MERECEVTLLIVEDHAPTANLLVEAFRVTSGDVAFTMTTSGAEALTILRDQDDVDRPQLVLLDLDLPEKSGLEVLKELQDDPTAHRPPIIVISSHSDRRNIRNCYHFGASSFITKPDEWEGFLTIAETIIRYWFDLVELPCDEHTARDKTDQLLL